MMCRFVGLLLIAAFATGMFPPAAVAQETVNCHDGTCYGPYDIYYDQFMGTYAAFVQQTLSEQCVIATEIRPMAEGDIAGSLIRGRPTILMVKDAPVFASEARSLMEEIEIAKDEALTMIVLDVALAPGGRKIRLKDRELWVINQGHLNCSNVGCIASAIAHASKGQLGVKCQLDN